MLLFPLNEHSDSDKSVVVAQSDRHDRYITTRILIDWVPFCNKSMIMQMELRDIVTKMTYEKNHPIRTKVAKVTSETL